MSSLSERIGDLERGFGKSIETTTGKTRSMLEGLKTERLYAILDEKNLSPEDQEYARRYYQTLGIKTVPLTRDDFDAFREMQILHRDDWEAVFNVDTRGGIYPQVRWGRTPEEEKLYSQGTIETLDRIASISVQARGKTGRLFIRQNGVYYKDQSAQAHRFIRFESPQQ